MRTIQKTVYTFSELSDAAKEKAREWYRNGAESSDLDCVVEDFVTIAELIGIEFDTHQVKLMNGKVRHDPDIYYSVGYCQSDFAAFSGAWRYKAGCLKALKSYAPIDETLQSIVSDWQALQKANFYQLRAICSERRGNQYVKEVLKGNSNRYDEEAVDSDIEKEVADIVRRLASWLYYQLRNEVDYQSSNDYVDEVIKANEYEFYENGKVA